MQTIRIAASQHAIQAAQSWQHFVEHMQQQVAHAVQHNAQLLVFAEYGSMALVPLLDTTQRGTLANQLCGLQAFAEDFSTLFCKLAQEHRTWIVAPSFPLATSENHYVNRVWIAGPDGQLFFQDKIHMTRFERELFDIKPGHAMQVIDTGYFRFAVAICYDVEFPEQIRALTEAGAQIIAVPSCTDSLHGFHRVLYCAQARAVENQCFVAQAPLTGDAPWCEAIDINVGRAGIFAPVDRGFPETGILAQGADDADGWVFADCDLDQMRQVREDGQVLNWRDRHIAISAAKTNIETEHT